MSNKPKPNRITKAYRCGVTGKRMFKSLHHAEIRIGEIMERGTEATMLRAYVCPSCGAYHLTHKPARKELNDNGVKL